MTKQTFIEQTLKAIDQLPENQSKRIADFALKCFEEFNLNKELTQFHSKNTALNFLNDDEELYSVADLKEVFK